MAADAFQLSFLTVAILAVSSDSERLHKVVNVKDIAHRKNIIGCAEVLEVGL